jgi:AraC family transcriptional regulator, regulatory protein of adaptative response / methylated-DNA-[protein]-cysteine methyltransferase
MDARWISVTKRDRKADGTFWYGVTTTRVYCRPSCASRQAKPKNVRFFSTIEAAEAAGFRACKRCKPKDASLDVERARLIARACRHIERAESVPKLDELAALAGMSAFHFHRVFKSVTGVTPRAYAAAHRARRVRTNLKRKETTVTDAIYDAGYASSARFYAQSNELLGMTPREARAGGARQTIRFAVGACSLGDILVAATDKGVCAIWMGDASQLLRELEDAYPKAQLVGGDAEFEAHVARVIAWVDARSRDARAPALPLDIRGTAFQQRVWRALRDIPPGATATYADVAKSIGAPKSVRAVASACAANTLAVVIPCHRVVRSDGALSGYRWGVDRKRTLLERERGVKHS